jgi:3-dehydroquinate synthase
VSGIALVAESVQSVRVEVRERGYEIRIGTGTLAGVGEFLKECGTWRRAVVIADAAIVGTHAKKLLESLDRSAMAAQVVSVPSGEKSKCVAEAERLWKKLLQLGADRKTLIVALGGGVVGDLAGFVAATYARGVPFLQVPTTLLAQVDSSVGGKVGVNLPGAKNMVGAFWQPVGVLIDTETLDTLPAREYLSGLAEVVKYGVILDAEFFARLERDAAALVTKEHGVLREVIARCCRLKADVVEADEREETGRRSVLNYGHTFAHAIEAVAGYGELLHGEAVSIGMMCAAGLAERLGRVDAEFVERQGRLLAALKLPVDLPSLDDEKLLAAMAHDKKVADGKLRFVLPTRLGEVELVDGIDSAHVQASLRG